MTSRVLGRLWDVYGARFAQLVGWTLAVVAPYEAALGLIEYAAPTTRRSTATLALVGAAGYLLLVTPLVAVLLVRMAEGYDAKRAAQPGRYLLEGIELLPVFFGTLLVVGLVMIGPLLVVELAVLAGAFGLVLAGAALFAVLQLVARLSLVIPVLVCERQRYAAALRRSNQLVRGAVGGVLVTLLVIVLLAVACALPGYLLGTTSHGQSIIAVRVGDLISVTLASPIVNIATYYLYCERRRLTSVADAWDAGQEV